MIPNLFQPLFPGLLPWLLNLLEDAFKAPFLFSIILWCAICIAVTFPLAKVLGRLSDLKTADAKQREMDAEWRASILADHIANALISEYERDHPLHVLKPLDDDIHPTPVSL